jgi:hypothetical protein
MISTIVSGGLLCGFVVGTWIDISHLLFADDILIFNRADPDYLRHMQCLFLCFEVVLGLKFNLAKLPDLCGEDALHGVRSLPDKGGYTKWPYLEGVPRHKK